MNQLQTEQLASQHIDELHRAAARARLVRTDPTRRYHAGPAFTFARVCAATRHWFARAQLAPANNYVTR